MVATVFLNLKRAWLYQRPAALIHKSERWPAPGELLHEGVGVPRSRAGVGVCATSKTFMNVVVATVGTHSSYWVEMVYNQRFYRVTPHHALRFFRPTTIVQSQINKAPSLSASLSAACSTVSSPLFLPPSLLRFLPSSACSCF